MSERSITALNGQTSRRVVNILEEQLAALDLAGASVAAVHLDAAIQQLKLDEHALVFGNSVNDQDMSPAFDTADIEHLMPTVHCAATASN